MFSSKTCYLIDDDIDDQEIFLMAVERVNNNIQCITASDCGEALDFLKREDNPKPNIIFLDLNMPKMGGKKCLEEIKKISYLQHIPVIIYSTSNEAKDKLETHQLGAAYYLPKPSSMQELTSQLNVILNKIDIS